MDTKYIEEFRLFLSNEIDPATAELSKITAEVSRKHLQKLVYTNVVDRFDYCVDKTLLSLVSHPRVIKELLEKHKLPLNESDLLELFIENASPRDFAIAKLKETMRNTHLRGRHSEKLARLLKSLGADDSSWKKPRVYVSTGKILKTNNTNHKQIPRSIEGFSDWLYSRRNAIVHGGGNSDMLANDQDQLAKRYKVTSAPMARLSVASIKTAQNFYSDLLTKIFDPLIAAEGDAVDFL